MTIARTWGVALSGIDGSLVEVEADLSSQLPEFRLIGLPDKALGEAQLRVRNATANCGMPLPARRLTVNLSPASLPKHGSGFDVAIAIAALATAGGFDPASLAKTVHLGELGWTVACDRCQGSCRRSSPPRGRASVASWCPTRTPTRRG